MKPIESPLQKGDSGEKVGNLQEALLLLIDKGIFVLPPPNPTVVQPNIPRLLTGEHASGKLYKDGTALAVSLFRDQFKVKFQLTPGKDVDEATAKAINTLLGEQGLLDQPGGSGSEELYVLRGQIVDAGGPLNDILVSVFDRDLFFGRQASITGQLLGSTATKANKTTGMDGWFELTYKKEQFIKGDIEKDGNYVPDLIFALSKNGQAIDGFTLYRLPVNQDFKEEVIASGDDLILGIPARRVEEVRIALNGGALKQEEPEYDRVLRALEPLIPEQIPSNADASEREKQVCAAAVQFNEKKYRDVTFVARETGLDWSLIQALSAAAKLSAHPFENKLPVSIFYGLARTQGASDFLALARLSQDDLRVGLEQATGGTKPVISPFNPAQRLKETVQLLRDEIAKHFPSYRRDENTPSLADLVGADLPDLKDQSTLWRIFSDQNGTADEFWEKLKKEPGFEDGKKITKVQYSMQLGRLAQNNIPLVNSIRSKHPNISSTVELAFHMDTPEKWTALLDKEAVPVPADVPGNNDHDRKANYAASLAVAMQVKHPTVAIANLVANLPANQLASAQPEVTKFLNDAVRTVQFDLVSDRIDELIANHGDKLLKDVNPKDRANVIDQVKRLQRLFRLSCSPESMKVLIDAGFNSAREIAELPPEVAMTMLKPALGETTARLIINRASNISSAALHQYIFLNGLVNDETINGEFL